MTLSIDSAKTYTDLQGLAELKLAAEKNSPEALSIVAKQFEALFIQQMLKGMRNASLSEGLFDSDAGDLYLDMFDKQLAINMSEGKGIGIADLLVKQLGVTVDKIAEVTDKLTPVTAPTLNSVSDQRSNPVAQLSLSLQPIDHHTITGAVKSKTTDSVESQADRIKTKIFSSPENFIQELWPLAQQAGQALGVDPKVILAQAALETGWGSAIKTVNGNLEAPTGSTTDTSNNGHLSSYNLFNIKAGSNWKGKTIDTVASEFVDGKQTTEPSSFRVYASYAESFADYVTLLKNNSRYYNVLKNASDNLAYVNSLQQAGYATDPRYAEKIMKIVDSKKIENSLTELKISMHRPIPK